MRRLAELPPLVVEAQCVGLAATVVLRTGDGDGFTFLAGYQNPRLTPDGVP